MKDQIIVLIIILAGCGWVVYKYAQKAITSSDEETRIIELAKGYNETSRIFFVDQAKKHHDEAFAASYRMWVLSPISELDLASAYDEQVYYRTIGKKISEACKQSKQQGAYKILLDIAKHYNVDISSNKRVVKKSAEAPAKKAAPKKESLLKSGKLGDKRTIPSSRKRYDDR